MTPEEKQSELQRHRDLLLACIDYLLSVHAGSFVLDDNDTIADYFEQQKLQIDKYYKHRRLDRLQKRLANLTKMLQNTADLNFRTYIKEKTGYDFDIFGNLRKRVNLILLQNRINDQKELNDICTMLLLLEKSTSSVDAEKLKSLISGYTKAKHKTFYKRKVDYLGVVSKATKDDIEEVNVNFSTGNKQYRELTVSAPDGKRRLIVSQWSDGKHATTSVTIQFSTGSSGGVYCISGNHPEVKASWKDNSTIVIETKKDYCRMLAHKKVRSFDDVINIEYVEHQE